MLTLVIIAVLHGGGTALAGATIGVYGNLAPELAGIEQAVGRNYYNDRSHWLGALVLQFDSEEHAAAALETLDPGNSASASLYADMVITIDGFGPETRAYHNKREGSSSVDILAQDATYLYIVQGTAFEAGADSVTPATAALRAMIAAEAGEGVGDFRDDGTSTGGAWDKLPPGDGDSPPGFTTGYDEQFYPESEGTGEGGIDFSQYEGAQRAVARTYIGDASVLASPAAAPAAMYTLAALVAEFDTPDHAAAAVDALHELATESVSANSGLTVEPTDPGDVGELAMAATGAVEEDGATYDVAVITVQDGAYVYVAIALGGGEAATLETGVAVIEAMSAADAGADAGSFDEAGGSTGGLWDKLPQAGDEVLQGLAPESDAPLYPDVE
jgi:hypothetical protein